MCVNVGRGDHLVEDGPAGGARQRPGGLRDPRCLLPRTAATRPPVLERAADHHHAAHRQPHRPRRDRAADTREPGAGPPGADARRRVDAARGATDAAPPDRPADGRDSRASTKVSASDGRAAPNCGAKLRTSGRWRRRASRWHDRAPVHAAGADQRRHRRPATRGGRGSRRRAARRPSSAAAGRARGCASAAPAPARCRAAASQRPQRRTLQRGCRLWPETEPE